MPLRRTKSADKLLIFPSDLGWMAVVLDGETVKQLTFGHPSLDAAERALARKASDPTRLERAKLVKAETRLMRRLRVFSAGNPDSFRDVAVDLGRISPFQRRVLTQCRKIPYGSTISYSELAARAGFPRAARAVGNCMAANRVPLIIPCHRVVRSDGRIGPYSGPGGTAMKRRLLSLESRKLA